MVSLGSSMHTAHVILVLGYTVHSKLIDEVIQHFHATCRVEHVDYNEYYDGDNEIHNLWGVVHTNNGILTNNMTSLSSLKGACLVTFLCCKVDRPCLPGILFLRHITPTLIHQ